MPRSPGPAPREWLLGTATRRRWERTGFGRADDPGWSEPEIAEERALLAAAQTQHRLAMYVRTRMERQGLSAEDMADKLDMSVDYFLDILSGSTHVYLADLHRIASILGVEFYAVFMRPRRETDV